MTELAAAALGRVLLPLVEGGELRPLPPIGSRRAAEAARLADFSGEAANEIQWRRLRVARRLCAVDRLPAPSGSEWLLVFALNDLLQATNPDLVGVFGRDRPARLIQMALELIELAGAPRTIGEAIGRHATFSRLLELVRIDTHVSWWVGSETFRGAEPPPRLLTWSRVRRVRRERREVPLLAMVADAESWSEAWRGAVARLLAASPLTDVIHAARSVPDFCWTGASLSLLRAAPGRTLMRRAALRGAQPALVRERLVAACERLANPEASALAQAFVGEL